MPHKLYLGKETKSSGRKSKAGLYMTDPDPKNRTT